MPCEDALSGLLYDRGQVAYGGGLGKRRGVPLPQCLAVRGVKATGGSAEVCNRSFCEIGLTAYL